MTIAYHAHGAQRDGEKGGPRSTDRHVHHDERAMDCHRDVDPATAVNEDWHDARIRWSKFGVMYNIRYAHMLPAPT